MAGRGVLVRTTVGVLAMACALGGTMPASAAAPGTADRSAQVQSVLDRVLGPGNSVVEISAAVRTSSGTATVVRWGRALPSSIERTRIRTPTGISTATTQVDAVDRTTTVSSTPAGSLLRQTVAVAVDRAATKSVPLRRLRRLVVAAAGLSAFRGDRLFLLRTSFPHPRPAAPVAASWAAALQPLAVPGIEAAGAVMALLLILVLAPRRRRRGGGPDLGRS